MLHQLHNIGIIKNQGPESTGPFLYAPIQKNHQYRCWLELNKQQFFSNGYWLKKLIGPDVAMAVVLKSNAYGHGLIEVGHLCQEYEHVSYLTVFLLSDALRLREAGITKRILILGGYDKSIADGILHEIDLLVYDWQTAKEIYTQALTLQKMVRVQLKVDTGLARLGFSPDEVLEVATYLSQNKFISIVGMYSHFAESDSFDTSFTELQIARMNGLLMQLKEHNFHLPFVHMANSAGALRFKDARFTMVRCGGTWYGSYKDERFYRDAQEIVPGFELQTVLTVKSRIIAIRNVPVGTPIGYARSFKTIKPMRLAIVAVGYYDGYDRRLSNTGVMSVHDVAVPIIGRVGMNMTTIDVTDVSQATIGDEVTVIGNKSGLRLKDIAQKMNVIEYEVMPPLNPLLPRIII